jgi:hypothetical protein
VGEPVDTNITKKRRPVISIFVLQKKAVGSIYQSGVPVFLRPSFVKGYFCHPLPGIFGAL